MAKEFIKSTQYPDALRRILGEAGVDNPTTIKFIIDEIVREISERTMSIQITNPAIAGDPIRTEEDIASDLEEQMLGELLQIMKANRRCLIRDVTHPVHGKARALTITLFRLY